MQESFALAVITLPCQYILCKTLLKNYQLLGINLLYISLKLQREQIKKSTCLEKLLKVEKLNL